MDLRIAIVPVGKMDPLEVEAVAVRVAKVLNKAVALRQTTPVPKAGDDPARGQHVAGPFLAELRSQLPRLAVAKTVGGAAAPDPAGAPAAAGEAAGATLFVTDVAGIPNRKTFSDQRPGGLTPNGFSGGGHAVHKGV